MEEFTIATRVTAKDYRKIMYKGLYKKPAFIIAAVIGLYLVITISLDFLNLMEFQSDNALLYFICGVFLLLAPTLIVFLSVRQFKSMASFQQDIFFSFSESGVKVEAPTCKSEFSWTHIIKYKEIHGFLILHQSNKSGFLIDKQHSTTEQLAFIKMKIKRP